MVGTADGVDFVLDCATGFLWMIDYLDGRITPLLMARSPEEFFSLLDLMWAEWDRREDPDSWYRFRKQVPPELAESWAYYETCFELT